MQGKALIVVLVLTAMAPTVALAGETARRQTCTKTEQPQQRQQVQQRERAKPQGCQVQRTIPPVVDPTPTFLL